jgi:hypothetical protein
LAALFECEPDCLENTIKLFSDLMIPKPQNEDSLTGKKFSSRSIMYFAPDVAMPASIKLNCEMSFGTIEIYNVTVDGMLAPELVVREVPISKMTPQRLFITRSILAQVTRSTHKPKSYPRNLADETLLRHWSPSP